MQTFLFHKNFRSYLGIILCFAMILPFFLISSDASVLDYEIQEMREQGLVPSSFQNLDLNQKITRGEMCELAVLAFETATGNSLDFVDEDGSTVQYNYFNDVSGQTINKAHAYGIVDGYSDGSFRPDNLLTRQQFFKIIANFCEAASLTPTAGNETLSEFSDRSQVASYAITAAKFCVKNGYVNGINKNGSLQLDPEGNTTRKQAMAMFWRCYKGLKEYYYYTVTASSVWDDPLENVSVTDTNKTMYVVTNSSLNVRSYWNTNSTVLGSLTAGSPISVTGTCSNGWYRISYNGKTGYVSGQYVSETSNSATGSTTPTETPSVIGSGTNAVKFANLAVSFVGYSYVYGGASPSGFDCSGLVYYCMKQLGYSVNRVADDQMHQGTAVDKSNLQTGDLVFFGYNGYANHVGIYIGNGNFVHASTPSSGVRINALNESYYAARYIGARRIITD